MRGLQFTKDVIAQGKFNSKKNQKCSVCHDPIVAGANIGTLMCVHIYHYRCIDRWLRRSSKCPTCRFDVLED